MDFSQLPKMSDTPKPPPPENDEPTETAPSRPRDPSAVASAQPAINASMDGGFGFGFASVWISLILGFILLMLGANFGRWATATLAGKPFNTGVEWSAAAGDKAGQMVGYFDLQGGTAWSETGLFLMGIALLLDAMLMFVYFRRGAPSKALVLGAIFFTGLALAINVLVAIKLFGMGILPLITMCAILVGGMILFDHVPLLGARKAR